MAAPRAFLGYVLELLEPLGGVTARPMFGGAGLYLDGTIFGLIADDILYFKVDETNRQDYEEAGTGPFVPFEDGRMTMPYREIPADVMEDPDTLRDWARKAWQAGRRTEASAPKAKRPWRGKTRS